MFALVAVLWGSTSYFTELALRGFSPAAIALSRVLIGSTVLLVALCCSARPPDRLPLPRGRVFLLGVVWIAAPLTLFPLAQERITASTAGVITGAQPLLAAVVAALILRRAPDVRVTLGLLIGFTGAVTLAFGAEPSGTDQLALLGIGQALVATACYAVAVNLVVPLQQRFGGLRTIAGAQLAALAILLPMAMITRPTVDLEASAVLSVLVLGLGHTGIAYLAMAALAGRVGGVRASAAIYLVPFVALLLGVLLLRDPAPATLFAAVGLVTIGTALTAQGRSVRMPRRASNAVSPQGSAAGSVDGGCD